VKLERHIGGMGVARKRRYLLQRGWTEGEGVWMRPDLVEPLKLSKAIHVQLTDDLSAALKPSGWTVVGYSPRGYVQMRDGKGEVPDCSLPKALRVQARREKRLVGELTYSLFLGQVLEEG
jgi:hypothetical protein